MAQRPPSPIEWLLKGSQAVLDEIGRWVDDPALIAAMNDELGIVHEPDAAAIKDRIATLQSDLAEKNLAYAAGNATDDQVFELLVGGERFFDLAKLVVGSGHPEGRDFADLTWAMTAMVAGERLRHSSPVAYAVQRWLMLGYESIETLPTFDPLAIYDRLAGNSQRSADTWPGWVTIPLTALFIPSIIEAKRQLTTVQVVPSSPQKACFDWDLDFRIGWDRGPDLTPQVNELLERAMTQSIRLTYGTEVPDRSVILTALITLIVLDDTQGGPGVYIQLGGSAGGRVDVAPEGARVKMIAAADAAIPGHLAFLWTPAAPNIDDFDSFRRLGDGEGSVGAEDARGELGFSFEGLDGQPAFRLGGASGSRLEFKAASLGLGLDAGDLHVFAAVSDGLLVLEPGALGHGIGPFLESVGMGEVSAKLDGKLRIDGKGMRFSGEAGLRTRLAANLGNDSLRLEYVELEFGHADEGGMKLAVAAAAKLRLGPFEAALDRFGLDYVFSRSRRGEIVPVAPQGLGVRIDTGLKGGGFLRLDFEHGHFAGAFEFTFAKVSLKALVELHTKVEGAPFALLAMVYARFPGGLELGLRFTLNAVGGMIGINRGFDYQALVEGLSSGAMDDILFPEDPVADAPRIFASLAAVCPVRPGAYTLALMAELGWGSDYICALRLGIVLPLDDMRRIYLIGQVRIQCFRHMPETVRLQLICDAAGAIGFDPFSLRFDGRLRDSRFGPIGIEGQIVLLLDTGENPRFLVAAGGFHPNFKAIPAGLPSKIDRLAVTYEVGGFKAWMKGYFALAAGTVQFGAEVGCRYKAGSIAFTGNLGIDALIHISPFTFEAETRFNVAVEYRGHELFGVHVTATLWGPDHWRIKGHGSFSILFWDVGIDFDESWGDDVAAAVEPVVLLAKAADDLANDTYWQFETPAAAGMVHLASGAAAGAAVHPLASLAYRQRRFPFGMELDRIGSAPVSGPRSVPVPAFHATLDGTPIPGDAALDPFAVGEYVELDDEARLTRPSFEPLPAGVSAGIAGYRLPTGGAVEAELDYEQVVLPRRTKFTGLADLHANLVAELLGHEAAGRSPVRAADKLARPRPEKITAGQPRWAAADPATLAPIADPAAPAWAAHAPTALYARRKDTALTLEAFEMAA